MEKLDQQVYEIDWKDHHSPFLPYLIKCIKDCQDFLMENVNNIAVIHCMAGKGRTGTVIGCYLLSTGLFRNTRQALTYYSKKRLVSVTQPDQKRYVEYFERLMKMELGGVDNILPVKKLTKVIFKTIPNEQVSLNSDSK